MDWNSEPNKEKIVKTERYEIWRAGIHRDVLRIYSKGAGKRSEVLLDDGIRDGQIEGNLGGYRLSHHFAHVEVSKLNDVIVVQHGDTAKHDLFTAYGILEPDNPRSRVEVCYFPCAVALENGEQQLGPSDYFQPDYETFERTGKSGEKGTLVSFHYGYGVRHQQAYSGTVRGILWQNNKWYESLEASHPLYGGFASPISDFSAAGRELTYEVPHGTKNGFKDLGPGDRRGTSPNSPRIIALRP